MMCMLLLKISKGGVQSPITCGTNVTPTELKVLLGNSVTPLMTLIMLEYAFFPWAASVS